MAQRECCPSEPYRRTKNVCEVSNVTTSTQRIRYSLQGGWPRNCGSILGKRTKSFSYAKYLHLLWGFFLKCTATGGWIWPVLCTWWSGQEWWRCRQPSFSHMSAWRTYRRTYFVMCFFECVSQRRYFQKKTETDRTCSMYGKVKECIQGFGGKTWGKEATWKNQA